MAHVVCMDVINCPRYVQTDSTVQVCSDATEFFQAILFRPGRSVSRDLEIAVCLHHLHSLFKLDMVLFCACCPLNTFA